ncbi:MAG: hypothetical protein AMXMBFR64_45740 [Myxococcales bacterium]
MIPDLPQPRSTPESLRVEIHSHPDEAPLGGLDDVTDWVQAVSWSASTTAPWGQASLTLQMPMSDWPRHLPKPGDWLVIRGAAGAALWWGRVQTTTPRLEVVGGAIQSATVEVQAVSWLDDCANVVVQVGQGLTPDPMRMSLVDATTWGALIETFTSLAETAPGVALQSLLQTLQIMYLPPTLGGLPLGQAIQVAHDEATGKTFAPTRVVEAVPARYWRGFAAGRGLGDTATSVRDLIAGTWGVDGALVELFPSLEAFGTFVSPPPPPDLTTSEALQPSPIPFSYGKLTGSKYDPKAAKIDIEKARTIPRRQVARGLGAALKRNPTLVYRMRPVRVFSLSEVPKNPADIDPTLFKDPTWAHDGDSGFTHIPLTDIERLSWTWSEQRRATAVVIDPLLGMVPAARFMQELDLPIIDREGVAKHGYRPLEVRWPYIPPATEAAPPHMAYVKSIAYLALTQQVGGEQRGEGRFSGRFNTDLQAGQTFAVDLSLSAPVLTGPSKVQSDGRFHGYIRAVTHSIRVEPKGRRVARTDVAFEHAVLHLANAGALELLIGTFLTSIPGTEPKAGKMLKAKE